MKSSFMKFIWLVLILLLAVNHAFPQQVGVTAFQFLKVTPDARTTAMGDALASVSNSSAGAFGNPAALATALGEALRKQWSTEKLVEHGMKYSWDNIGRQIAAVYVAVSSRKPTV